MESQDVAGRRLEANLQNFLKPMASFTENGIFANWIDLRSFIDLDQS
jgi:hypothetical protein